MTRTRKVTLQALLAAVSLWTVPAAAASHGDITREIAFSDGRGAKVAATMCYDTGATTTFVTAQLATELRQKGIARDLPAVNDVSVQLADGTIRTLHRILINTVVLDAEHYATNVLASVVVGYNHGPDQGCLGVNILSVFGTVTFDFSRQVVSFGTQEAEAPK
jgi:hypothetical protein